MKVCANSWCACANIHKRKSKGEKETQRETETERYRARQRDREGEIFMTYIFHQNCVLDIAKLVMSIRFGLKTGLACGCTIFFLIYCLINGAKISQSVCQYKV